MKLYFQLLSICCILFLSCSKTELLTTGTKTDALATASKVTPNYLPGTCPYPCTDIRCKSYYNGYCGGGTSDTIAIKTNSNNPYDNVGN